MSANAAVIAEAMGLGGVYPQSWDEFVGQENVKRQLIIACRSAKIRGASLDPVLIRGGQPGIGKTTLALLIAAEMGGNLKMIAGPTKPQQVRFLLAGMQDGDVLFYDEIHQAVKGGKGNSEWLLHLLENGTFIGPLGVEDTPKISIVGATTDAGRLPRTVLDRFTPVHLTGYSEPEAARICLHMAGQMFDKLPMPSADDCRAIARAASHNPRMIRNLLAVTRDIALATRKSNHDGKRYDLTQALDFLGLTEDGLDGVAQRYLVALFTDFPTGAGERALRDRLQEPGGLQYVETALLDKGLIAMTKQGRMLTGEGIRRAKELKAQASAA